MTIAIKDIFDKISKEPKTNDKMSILKSFSNIPETDLLKRCLYLASSKRIKFYIKQIPSYTYNGTDYNLNLALNELEKLSNRVVTGSDAKILLQNILSSVNPDNAYIIERIIEKKPRIGMGTTNINKVFDGLIEKTPYMGAKPFDVELIKELLKKGPGISQTKMDGRYSNAIIVSGNEPMLESRQGEETFLVGATFHDELNLLDDCVLNGEFTSLLTENRMAANGMIASLVSIGDKILENKDVAAEIKKFEKENNVTYQEALDSIVYTVWDMITFDEYLNKKSTTPYYIRLENLKNMLNKYACTRVVLIESRIVTTFQEALDHFNENLEKGLEGTILKEYKGEWANGKKNNQIKFKLEMNVDLIITGFNYGTGKNAHLISSLNAKSTDGLLITKPTGIDEKMMAYITNNQDKLLGTVVECKCSGVSKNSSGAYSLMHPVFEKLRSDKTTGDDLNAIIAIENGVKGLS